MPRRCIIYKWVSWKGFAQFTIFISSLSIYPSAHNQMSEGFPVNQLYIS